MKRKTPIGDDGIFYRLCKEKSKENESSENGTVGTQLFGYLNRSQCIALCILMFWISEAPFWLHMSQLSIQLKETGTDRQIGLSILKTLSHSIVSLVLLCPWHVWSIDFNEILLDLLLLANASFERCINPKGTQNWYFVANIAKQILNSTNHRYVHLPLFHVAVPFAGTKCATVSLTKFFLKKRHRGEAKTSLEKDVLLL